MKSHWKVLLISLLIMSVVFYMPSAKSGSDISSDIASSDNPVVIHSISLEPETNRDFIVYDFDTDTHYEVASSLLASGEHCYIYMQDSMITQIGASEAQSLCESYRTEFDTRIYQTVVDLTGNPNGTIGDIDGDPHIIILINDNPVSYYSQYNEIAHPWSNECEMIYIYYPNNLILDTIAHEFCHLIWFNYEFDEVHFVLEGLAEYATYQCGYLESFDNRSRRTDYFLDSPNDPLIYFDVASRDYGDSYLFAFYLAEQFGVQFLQELVQHEEDGAYGVETALQEAGYDISFNQLYLDWITALTINELGFADDRYGFHNLDVKIEETSVIENVPFEIDTLDVWCYGSNIYELAEPTDGFTIEISKPSLGKIGLSVPYHDSNGWHISQVISNDTIIENVTGTGIDSAYVIVTYFYSDTPAGEIDFGIGMTEEIEFSISNYLPPYNPTGTNTTDTTLTNLILIVGIGGGSVGLSVVVLILYSKKQK